MKLIRYTETWYEVGRFGYSESKYTAGQTYPVTEETSRHVVQGIAEEIDVDEPVATGLLQPSNERRRAAR